MLNRILGSLMIVMAGTGSLLAQAPATPEKPKPLLTVTGTLRTRVEGWEWFEGEADNTYAFSGSLLRLAIGQQKKHVDWQVEFAAPILLGLPNQSVAAGAQGQMGLGAGYFIANDASRNAAMAFVKQGYVRFKNLGGNSGQSLRLGRMEFIDATEVTPKNTTLAALKRDRLAHRLIGNFGWSHVGRSLDGLQYGYNSGKNSLVLLGARPTRGVFQVDGWGELNIAVGYGAYTRQLGTPKSVGELRLLGAYYDDWRPNVVKTDNRPLTLRRADANQIRIATLGGHYIHALESQSGIFDVVLWGVFQAGQWGIQDHRAGAVVAEAGFQPKIWKQAKPWIRGGYQYASGDGNPNDGSHHTFFQMLPTPRIYARFPFYNMMNSEDAFGELILRPHSRMTVRADVHSLRLANANDLWYQGGGAYQPWTFGFAGRPSGGNRGLATLADVSADYQINAKITISGYLGNAWGRGVVESIYPKGQNALLGYVELGYKF
jgi:hypothetical protein